MARPNKDIVEARKKFLQDIIDSADKPSLFSELFLDYKLHDYNAEYADSKEQFLIYRSGRQAGKTSSTAVKAIHGAFYAPLYSREKNPKEFTILIVAPTQNQSSIMFDRIRTLIQESAFLAGYIVKNTQTEIWVRYLDDTGVSRIITRATGETGSQIRGYSPSIIIVDETAFIKESIMEALLPSGFATHARVWLTSTPFGKNNYFYKQHADSRPSNPKGMWKEFHVKSTDNPMSKGNPLFENFIKNLSADAYQQEVEGEFLDIGNALIPYNLLRDALSDKKPQGYTRYYMGVDVARTGRDETVFIIIAVDENENVFVVDYYAEGQSNLVDVAGKIGEYTRNPLRPLEMIYVDETGLGGGLIDLCHKQDLPVRGVTFSLSEKSKIFSNVRALFENHRVKLKSLDKLFHQLSYLRREYTEEGKMKVKTEDANIHDDYADAFALAASSVVTGAQWHVIEMSDDFEKHLFG